MTIYFLQPEGEPFVKIGHAASDVIERLTSLQIGNHRKLKVLAEVSGGRRQEAALHIMFSKEHERGEWFRLTKEVHNTIKRIVAGNCQIPDYGNLKKQLLKGRRRKRTKVEMAEANSRRGPQKNRDWMPWAQVAKFYFDRSLSNAEVERAVAKGFAPMSYFTMRRHFKKPRGARVGRPATNGGVAHGD